MENVDFTNLEDLSIPELMAIYNLAQAELNNLEDEKKRYGQIGDIPHRHGILGPYYTDLADRALSFATGKVFDITGNPFG